MMISTRGRYALRVMIDLAEHIDEGYIPLQTIAKRQGISEKYLESILAVLSKAGRSTPCAARAAATACPNRRRSIPRLRYCP